MGLKMRWTQIYIGWRRCVGTSGSKGKCREYGCDGSLPTVGLIKRQQIPGYVGINTSLHWERAGTNSPANIRKQGRKWNYKGTFKMKHLPKPAKHMETYLSWN